jgi:hypothetical protein
MSSKDPKQEGAQCPVPHELPAGVGSNSDGGSDASNIGSFRELARALVAAEGDKQKGEQAFNRRCKELRNGIEVKESVSVGVGAGGVGGVLLIGAVTLFFMMRKAGDYLTKLAVGSAFINVAVLLGYVVIEQQYIQVPKLKLELSAVGDMRKTWETLGSNGNSTIQQQLRAAQAIYDRETSDEDVNELLLSLDRMFSTAGLQECSGDSGVRCSTPKTLAGKIVAVFEKSFGAFEVPDEKHCLGVEDIVAGRIADRETVAKAVEAKITAQTPKVQLELAGLFSRAFDQGEDVPGAIQEAQEHLRKQWAGPVADRLVDDLGGPLLDKALTDAAGVSPLLREDDRPAGERLNAAQFQALLSTPRCDKLWQRSLEALKQVWRNTSLLRSTHPEYTLDTRRRRWTGNGYYTATVVFRVLATEVLLVLLLMMSQANTPQVPMWACAIFLLLVVTIAAATLLASWSTRKASNYEKERDTVSKQYARLVDNLKTAQDAIGGMANTVEEKTKPLKDKYKDTPDRIIDPQSGKVIEIVPESIQQWAVGLVEDELEQKHKQLLGLSDDILSQLRACGLHQVEDRARPSEAIPWWGIAIKATILLLCLLVLVYLWAQTKANMARLGTQDVGAFVRLPPTYVLVTAAASVLIALFTVNALIDIYGERARYRPPACGLRR